MDACLFALPAAFLLSGAAGLIFQMVWFSSRCAGVRRQRRVGHGRVLSGFMAAHSPPATYSPLAVVNLRLLMPFALTRCSSRGGAERCAGHPPCRMWVLFCACGTAHGQRLARDQLRQIRPRLCIARGSRNRHGRHTSDAGGCACTPGESTDARSGRPTAGTPSARSLAW